MPYLDQELVDHILSLPDTAIVKDGWSRWILRAALKGTLASGPEALAGAFVMSDELGQLGLGHTSDYGGEVSAMGDDLPAVALGTGLWPAAIAAGSTHTCALLTDGAVKCWGQNYHGELGLGDTATRGDEAGEMGDSLPAVALPPLRSVARLEAALADLPLEYREVVVLKDIHELSYQEIHEILGLPITTKDRCIRATCLVLAMPD